MKYLYLIISILILLFWTSSSLSQSRADTLFSKSLGYIHYGHFSNIDFYSNKQFYAKSTALEANHHYSEIRGTWYIKNDTIKIDSMFITDTTNLLYYYPNGFALKEIFKENKLDTIATINKSWTSCTPGLNVEKIYFMSNNTFLNLYKKNEKVCNHSIGKWTANHENKIVQYNDIKISFEHVSWIKKIKSN